MALNPVNYSDYIGIQVGPSFGDEMDAAFKRGRDERAAMEQQKMQQQQMLRRQKIDEMIFGFAQKQNPTVDDYLALSAITSDKGQVEKINKIWSEKSKQQQDKELLRMMNIFNSISAGDKELTKKFFDDAMLEDPDDQELKSAARLAELDPELSREAIGAFVVQLPGGKEALDASLKVAAELRKRDKFSPELRKMEAEASSAETAAAFAPDKAALERGKLNLDFQKIAGDIEIQKLDKKIKTAEQIAQSAKNPVAQEKMQIELENLKRDRDEKLAEKVEKAKNSAMMSDNLLETTDEILSMALVKNKDGTPVSLPKSNDPKFEQKIGKLINLTVRNATGPVQARTPTLLSRDVSDLETLVGQLGDQILIDRIDLMSGVLTQSDADALKKSLKSLDMKSSPERLLKNVIRIQELTQKARKISMERYGSVKGTSIPDTPMAAPSSEEVQAIYEKYRQR